MEQSRPTSVIPAGRVAVVAHDAGGAEILSSWIRRNQPDHVAVLGGPASAIFKRKVPDLSISGMTEAHWSTTYQDRQIIRLLLHHPSNGNHMI